MMGDYRKGVHAKSVLQSAVSIYMDINNPIRSSSFLSSVVIEGEKSNCFSINILVVQNFM